MGVNFFILTSLLKQQTYIYIYDEQTSKKGSNEVISMLAMHIKKHVPSDMLEMLVNCDRCMGQERNNRLTLLFDEILDVDSSK